MTYHVARDGTQLGTFSLEEIRSALASGQILSTDLAWKEGMNDWEPVSSLALQTTSAPPPVPTLPVSSLPPTAPVVVGGTKTCGQAIASMILGVLGCVLSCLTAIPAVVLGHIALGKIKRSGGLLSGRGLAITGLIFGYLQVAMIPVWLGLAVPAFTQVQQKALTIKTQNEARQVIIALKSYAAEHNGTYPETLEVLVTENLLLDNTVLKEPLNPGWTGEPGWDYFGTSISDSSPGDSVLISSRSTGPQGERVIGLNDGSVETQKGK